MKWVGLLKIQVLIDKYDLLLEYSQVQWKLTANGKSIWTINKLRPYKILVKNCY